jgi:predicted nucleic acid-binding protein
MKIAYVDTSCLVAVAFGEPQAEKLRERLAGYDRLVSSNLLEAEFRSALSRERVSQDSEPLLSWVGWVYPDRPLTREYREVLDKGHARGADLWHLACALFLRRKLPDVAFATLDGKQHGLAKTLGFS